MLTSEYPYRPKVSYELYYKFPHFSHNKNDPTENEVVDIQEFVDNLLLVKADIRMKYKIVHEGYIYTGTCSPEVK